MNNISIISWCHKGFVKYCPRTKERVTRLRSEVSLKPSMLEFFNLDIDDRCALNNIQNIQIIRAINLFKLTTIIINYKMCLQILCYPIVFKQDCGRVKALVDTCRQFVPSL